MTLVLSLCLTLSALLCRLSTMSDDSDITHTYRDVSTRVSSVGGAPCSVRVHTFGSDGQQQSKINSQLVQRRASSPAARVQCTHHSYSPHPQCHPKICCNKHRRRRKMLSATRPPLPRIQQVNLYVRTYTGLYALRSHWKYGVRGWGVGL